MPYLTRPCPIPEPMDCRILTAALDLFVDKGYHNVSVHEVREKADVSIGSVYKHFGGKEGIADALYTHILGEFDLLLDEIIRENESPRSQCLALVAALFRHTESHKNIIAYMFHAKHSEFLPDQPPMCNARPFQRMRAMVEQGMNTGEFKQGDPYVASSVLFGAMARMIQLRLDGVVEHPLPDYADEICRTALEGMTNARQIAKSVAP